MNQLSREARNVKNSGEKRGEIVARLILRSYDHAALDLTCKHLIDDLLDSGFHVNGAIMLPTKRKFWTFLAAPNCHKDARQQLELRYSKRLIEVIGSGLEISSVFEIFSKRDFDHSIEFYIR